MKIIDNYFYEKIPALIQSTVVTSFLIAGMMISTAQEAVQRLPTCIVGELCAFLSLKDACSLSQVNKNFYIKTKKAIQSKVLKIAHDQFFKQDRISLEISPLHYQIINNDHSLSLGNWLRMATIEREKFFTLCYEKDLFEQIMNLAMFPEYSLTEQSWPAAYYKNPKTGYEETIDLNNHNFIYLYFYEMAIFCCKFNQLNELKTILAKDDFVHSRIQSCIPQETIQKVLLRKHMPTQLLFSIFKSRDHKHPLDYSFKGVFTKSYFPMTNGTLLAIARKYKSDEIVSYFEKEEIVLEEHIVEEIIFKDDIVEETYLEYVNESNLQRVKNRKKNISDSDPISRKHKIDETLSYFATEEIMHEEIYLEYLNESNLQRAKKPKRKLSDSSSLLSDCYFDSKDIFDN